MLFIGRTMNKETQLGRKKERKRKNRTIQRVAHITCGISRSSHNRFPVNVCGWEYFPTGRALSSIQSCKKKKCPWSSDVLVQMLRVRLVWCSVAAQSWCHGAIQLQRNMSHLKLPFFLPGGWISLLPNRISSSFLQMRSQNVQWIRTFLFTSFPFYTNPFIY